MPDEPSERAAAPSFDGQLGPGGAPRATVVVPVAADPKHARWRLEQLYRHTETVLFRLVVADCGADAETRRILAETVEAHPNAEVVDAADGGRGAISRGLAAARTDAVVLLDPRVLVTAGWLDRLLAPLVADPAVGLVCPLSNTGAETRVALPAGYSFADVAELVAAHGERRYPDVREASGGCLLVRREVLARACAGELDAQHEGKGLDGLAAACLAAARALGRRAVVADDCYVYDVREPVSDESAPLTARPDLVYDAVYYLPPTAAGVGGMISVVEIVNRLILLGRRATVATVGSWRVACECLFRPLCYASEAAFLAFAPRTRVLVATGYQTVEPVATICRAYGYAPAYFIQDYEGYFGNGVNLSAVARTYAEIPHRIAVSRWVQGLLRDQHGLDSAVIPLGVATDEFYPHRPAVPRLGELRARGRFLVFAMLRGDDRRGAPYLVEAARRLARICPEITFVFAGRYGDGAEGDGRFRLPALDNALGVGLLDRRAMADYLAACDVVVDASLYQGFGMLGIEAMASGTPAVLSRTGGALEYARDGENCLLFAPRDVRGLCDALLRLRADPALAGRLADEGRRTALPFDWTRLAARHAEFFAPLLPERTSCGRPVAAGGRITTIKKGA